MEKTNKTLKLYFSDAGKLLASPVKWTRTEYIHFFLFIAAVSFCFVIDLPVRQLFQSLRSDSGEMIFKVGDIYGKGYIQAICLAVLLIMGYKYNRILINYAHLFLESLIFSGIAINVLKVTCGRWRPFTDKGNLHFTPFVGLWETGKVSLPSADVALAFSTSLILAELYDNKLWKALWYFLAVMTALGRIYHDKHWSSDVVISIFICFYIVRWLKTQPLFISSKNFSSELY